MHSVKLDWITPKAEQVIAKHARVSTTDPDREEYARLITYCIKHWPLVHPEQANASFEIITSRAISAQLIRHKTLCFQELSQRYTNPFTTMPDGIHDRPHEFLLRKQAEKNRQSSTEPIDQGVLAHFRDRIYMFDAQVMRSTAICSKQAWHGNVPEMFCFVHAHKTSRKRLCKVMGHMWALEQDLKRNLSTR